MGTPAFETLDEVHCEYRAGDGQLRRRQIYKQVLNNRGGWALIIFAWQDWRATGKAPPSWQRPRYAMERWRRVAERWHRVSRLAIDQKHARTALAIISELDHATLIEIADMRDDHEKTPPGGQEPGEVVASRSAEAESS